MLLFPFSTIYTSFFLVFQNSLDRCWTLLQCFLQYRSGKVRWPGCGITTFDFIIRRFTGLRGARLVTSFSTSVVNGLEFMIASTSRTRVYKDRSYKLFRGIFSKEFKIALALRISSSQTPPMLLDSGGFLFHIIHSPSVSFKKSPILIWSISWNARVSSDDALTWFEPLLDLIILTLPPHPTNLLKFMMNEPVLREYTTSTSMALLNRQVYRAPCLLTSSRPSFTRNDPNKSTRQYVNGGFSLILFPEKSVKEIYSSPKCLLWTDLIISFSTIFIPSKSNGTLKCCFVWSKFLEDLFPLMQVRDILLTLANCKLFLLNLKWCLHVQIQHKIWFLFSIQGHL